MTRFGVAVTMNTTFRGVAQPFSNVYHYEIAGLAADQEDALEALLDQIVANMKVFHATAVNFVRGRVWNTGQGQSANMMRVDKALSGAGSSSTQLPMDRERVILARWPAGRNSRGKPVFLRKYFHVITGGGTATVSDAVLANTGPLSQVTKDYFQPKIDAMRIMTDVATQGRATYGIANLCAQSGRLPEGPAQIHDFLEHHQLGDAWRG